MIETKRMTIRPFGISDLFQFERILEIPELESWRLREKRASDLLNWHIAQYQAMDVINGTVCLGMFHMRTERILGAAGIRGHADLGEPELFVHVIPDVRNRGFGKEAAAAVTQWAVENYPVRSLVATPLHDDYIAQKLLRGCGYKFMEELPLPHPVTGEPMRCHGYRYDPRRIPA